MPPRDHASRPVARRAIFLLRGRAREEKRRLSQASLLCEWAGLGGGGLAGKNIRRKHAGSLSIRRRRIAYLPYPFVYAAIFTSTHIRHGCKRGFQGWEKNTLIAGQSPLPTNELQHIVQSVRFHSVPADRRQPLTCAPDHRGSPQLSRKVRAREGRRVEHKHHRKDPYPNLPSRSAASHATTPTPPLPCPTLTRPCHRPFHAPHANTTTRTTSSKPSSRRPHPPPTRTSPPSPPTSTLRTVPSSSTPEPPQNPARLAVVVCTAPSAPSGTRRRTAPSATSGTAPRKRAWTLS